MYSSPIALIFIVFRILTFTITVISIKYGVAVAVQYQFAHDENDKIVSISDADKSGTYHCIACNDILIPKQGSVNQWHFCHKHEQENCSNESYLHKLAKQKFYNTYKDCLLNNKPFYVLIKHKYRYTPCDANNKFNVCPICDYCRTRAEQLDLTQWFKNIEIEKSVDAFRADVCLSTPDNSQHIFIEIHVSNKVSDKKEHSQYRIIEIDINEENDLALFDNNLLSPSEKVRFLNFKTPERTITNDRGCKKSFKILYLAKNGGVYFKDNLNISELNKQLFFNQGCWVRHNIVAEQPCDDYTDYDMCIDFHHGAGDSTDYMRFIANCANENLNVKNCFICRYHADADSMWSTAPIFCKFLKKECKSSAAIDCQYFRKEDNYVRALLESNKENDCTE